jgi:hypothetical protein
LLLSLVGWTLLAVPPVVVARERLAPAVPSWTVVGAVAVPAAVGYWYTGRSVATLGAVVFRLTVVGSCLGVAVPVAASLSGVTAGAGGPTTAQLEVGAVATAYLLTAVWHHHGPLLFGPDATLTPSDSRQRDGDDDAGSVVDDGPG